MFGYVRPARDRLPPAALERYQAVYCGLCRTLGSRYGWLARWTLNYDFAFLALLLCRNDTGGETCMVRCPAHPLKKRRMCRTTVGMNAAADESMILTVHKLRDAIRDEGFWRSLPARVLARLLTPAYRRAAALRPAFDRAVRACLTQLDAYEQENCTSLDRTADCFARILAAAVPPADATDCDRTSAQMLYHLGRWIYLIDALDDLQGDIARGRYNPIGARFGGVVDRELLRTTLQHSRAIACSAYRLMPPWEDGVIVENVLMDGLPAVEELVFRGEWKAGRGASRKPKQA